MADDDRRTFAQKLSEELQFRPNPYHPLVWILGEPEIGEGVYIGGMSEINATGARVRIGKGCDIASFVSINCADSHLRCIGLADEVSREDIVIEDHVFIGSHACIKGGAHIGHHSVVAAGSMVSRGHVPPYSLVAGNPAVVKPGYFLARKGETGTRDPA